MIEDRLHERNNYPRQIRLHEGLPRDSPFYLKIQDELFYVPEFGPVFGLWKLDDEKAGVAYLQEDSIGYTEDSVGYFRRTGVLNLVGIKGEERTLIARVGIDVKNRNAKAHGLLLDPDGLHDFLEMRLKSHAVADEVAMLVEDISEFRYNAKRIEIVSSRHRSDKESIELRDISTKTTYTGYFRYSGCSHLTPERNDLPINDDIRLSYNGRLFDLPIRFENQRLPIIGLYTHPIYRGRICLARSVSMAKGYGAWNSILINEIGSTERQIGLVNYRQCDGEAVCTDFYIGKTPYGLLPKRSMEKYRGQGLGSRVMESFEEYLRNKRFETLYFENVIDHGKPDRYDIHRFLRHRRFGVDKVSNLGHIDAVNYRKAL